MNSLLQDTYSTTSSKNSPIGHYQLGPAIGEGTFGKVRLGTHVLTGEKVAIKILEKSKIADSSDIDRVAREIHILKIVRHPHIIQLYEIIETSSQLYLVTEYACGGELFDHIVACKRVPELEACKFFHQILSAIEYLHRIGIVHRDLKPENLLLDQFKDIKMVDFGLSNIYQTGEKLKTACGSPCYAAPEMISGRKYVAIQVDIWSAGIVLFALVCGYLPFEDPDTPTLYAKILKGEYKLARNVSNSLKDLLKGILNTDPNRRFTIADIRKHPWYSLIDLKEPAGVVVGLDPIPINAEILSETNKYGFSPEMVKKFLQANKHNHATTTYNLLLRRKMRELNIPSAQLYEFGLGTAYGSAIKSQPLKIRIKEKLNTQSANIQIPIKNVELPNSKTLRRKTVLHEPNLVTPNIKVRENIQNVSVLTPILHSPLPYIAFHSICTNKRGSIGPIMNKKHELKERLNESLIIGNKGKLNNSQNDSINENSVPQQITMIKPKINHVTIITSPNNINGFRIKRRPYSIEHTPTHKQSKHKYNLSNCANIERFNKVDMNKKITKIYIPKKLKQAVNHSALQ